MTSKPKKSINIDAFVKGKLRRASIFWPARTEAKNRSRVSRGRYKCEECQSILKSQEIELDHKEPVIPLSGMILRPDGSGRIDYNAYVDRLFCSADNFAVLCIQCHSIKTELEGKVREHHRDIKKKKKGKKK